MKRCNALSARRGMSALPPGPKPSRIREATEAHLLPWGEWGSKA